MSTKRFQVGQVLVEKRYASGRYTKHVPVVFERGARGNTWNAVVAFGGFARGVSAHDFALAADLADELNGTAYVPPVLRAG